MSVQRNSTSSQPFTSPIPLPDSSLFDMRVFSDKRSNQKIRPPSPPTKSPPYSRVYTGRGSFGQATAQTPQPIGHTRTPSSGGSVPSLYKEKFEEIQLIGRGSFGEVYKVKDKEKQKYFAVKKLKKLNDRKRAMGEAFVGCSLPEHPNCVKYINAWEEDYSLYIQTELCYGSLKEYIDKKDVIPEEEIWNFILDIALGLKHIHDNKLIHLDIKPGNILFSKDGRTLKIGDFGLTAERRESLDEEGDCLYVAPEIFEGKYSTALDVFSLGATVFEIATNVQMPSNGKLWQDLRSNPYFSLAPSPPARSPELEDLVRQMMERNPAKRISIDEILKHPILRSLHKKRSLFIEEDDDSEEEQDHRIKISRSAFKKEQREELRRQSLEALQGRKLDDDEEMETDDEFRQPQFDEDDDDDMIITTTHTENFDTIYSISPVNLLSRFDEVHD